MLCVTDDTLVWDSSVSLSLYCLILFFWIRSIFSFFFVLNLVVVVVTKTWQYDVETPTVDGFLSFFFGSFGWIGEKQGTVGIPLSMRTTIEVEWISPVGEVREREWNTYVRENESWDTMSCSSSSLLCNSLHDSIKPFTSAYPSHPITSRCFTQETCPILWHTKPGPKEREHFTQRVLLSLCVHLSIRWHDELSTHTPSFDSFDYLGFLFNSVCIYLLSFDDDVVTISILFLLNIFQVIERVLIRFRALPASSINSLTWTEKCVRVMTESFRGIDRLTLWAVNNGHSRGYPSVSP